MKRIIVAASLSSLFNLPEYFREGEQYKKYVDAETLKFMMFPASVHKLGNGNIWCENYVTELFGYMLMFPLHELWLIDGYEDGVFNKAINVIHRVANTQAYSHDYEFNVKIKKTISKQQYDNAFIDFKGEDKIERIIIKAKGDWMTYFLSKYPELRHPDYTQNQGQQPPAPGSDAIN